MKARVDMSRNILAIITVFRMAILTSLSLCACEQEPSHDELIAEMGASGRANYEKRQAFLSSEVYETACAFIEDTLGELLPGCEAEITPEPYGLLNADLSEYADFSENKETRIAFFSKAELYIFVNFWDFDADGFDLAKELAARGISGEMAADEYGTNSYWLNAETGKAEWVPEPGV